MKKFIKNQRIIKLFIVLLICILTITLTACGKEAPNDASYDRFDAPESGDTISDSIKDNISVDDITYFVNYLNSKNIKILKLSELIKEN